MSQAGSLRKTTIELSCIGIALVLVFAHGEVAAVLTPAGVPLFALTTLVLAALGGSLRSAFASLVLTIGVVYLSSSLSFTLFYLLVAGGALFLLSPLGMKIRAAEASLQISRAIGLEVTDYAVVLLDGGGRFKCWNRGAERIHGYRDEEVLGQLSDPLFPYLRPLLERAELDSRAEYEGWSIRKGGERFWAKMTVTAVRDGGDTREFAFVTHDLTQRRENEEVLKRAIDASPAALIVVDHEGSIQLFSLQAEKLFGYTRDEVVGRKIEMLLPEEIRERHRHYRDAFMSEHQARSMGAGRDLFGVRKDGTRIPVEIGLSPLTTRQGAFVVAAVVDISERKSAERERDELLKREVKARSESEAANRMKDLFLATVSHDLRAPLNAILGWAQMIKRDPSARDRVMQGIEVIERNVRSQSQLIEDLLDTSRIAAGKISLIREPVDLVEALAELRESMLPSARSAKIELITHLPAAPLIVDADKARLHQVLSNLVTNAIKFTPQGGSVTIDLFREGERATVRVSDTGIGIEPKHLTQIFESFRQEETGTQRHGGLGLGLSIARKLTELHQGEIRAASEGKGKGSTFTVTLPLVKREEVQQSEPRGKLLEGLEVLVVDDHVDSLELVRNLLEDAGAEVLTASDGGGVLSLLSKLPAPPNVLLSDIAMPEMNGMELLAEIRRLPPAKGQSMRAIAMTAFSSKEDEDRVLKAGFEVLVPKPIDADHLVNTLRNVLSSPLH